MMPKRKISAPMRVLRTMVIACSVLGLLRYVDRTYINLPFIYAAGNGNIQKVRDELDAGVPPDSPSWQTMTAMREACASNREEVVKLLLAHGADPNKGMSVARQYPNIVRLLVLAGARHPD